MDRNQASKLVIQAARTVGVDPRLLLSIWEQESAGSTDLGLRGPTLTRGRWKGHYARGPFQIMSFHGEIPDSFYGQALWAAQHLKERGVRGYYGEGTPGVPGQPTTDQYESQVLSRAGAPDVRLASADDPLPPEMQIPGNPMTGQADMAADPFGSLPPEMFSPVDNSPPSLGQRLSENPFIQIGLGILGNPSGAGNSPLTGVARGISYGLGASQQAEDTRQKERYNQARNWLWMQQLRNQQAQMMGLEQMNPYQRAQVQYQQGQIENAARELDLLERGAHNQSTGGDTTERIGIVDTETGKVRYEEIPKGTLPEMTPNERPFNPNMGGMESATGGSSPKGAKVDINKIDQAVSQVEFMKRTYIDPAGAQGIFADQKGGPATRFLKTLGQGLTNIYNAALPDPEEPSTFQAEEYERKLVALAGTLAKAFGDTGTLSEGDVLRALQSMPHPDKWPDAKSVAISAVDKLLEILRAKREAAMKGGGNGDSGTTPPEIGAELLPNSGPKVGDVEDGHRFKGGDPADPNNWVLLR